MTEKRYKLIESDPCEDPYDCRMYVGILEDDVKELYDYKSICDRLNELSEENEEFNEELMECDSFKRLYEEKIERLEKENKQLKEGMIGVVDRYIRNVEHNPPSSVKTYLKVKGALVNVREGLRDLLEDLE